MNPIQRIFNILASQEPMKVEFAPQSQSLAAKMQAASDEVVMTQKTLDKKIDDIQFVKQDSKEYAKKANDVLTGSSKLVVEAQNVLNELSSLGKDLGISENEIPEWRILTQRVSDLKNKSNKMDNSLKSLNKEL